MKNHVHRHGHRRVASSAIDWAQCHTERANNAIPARQSLNRAQVVLVRSGRGAYLLRIVSVDAFTPPGTPGAKKPAPEAGRPPERERR